MKRIVILTLAMLIGGYGVVQAEDQTNTSQQQTAQQQAAQQQAAQQKEEATTDFLNMKWGMGIGVIGTFGGDRAVEKASIDANKLVRVEEEGDLRPQTFLEMHAFFMGDKAQAWREYQRWKDDNARKAVSGMTETETSKPNKVPDCPLMGFGPFVALQSGDKKIIDSLAVGFMWGLRRDASKSSSLNIGVGLSFDPSVQVLRGDLKDGQKTEEKEIRFKKESRFGWALMTSYAF